MNSFREIPEHEHTHSVYTHCLKCYMWGIDMPKKFQEVSQCGNCGSLETVKYYPSCCIIADRNAQPKQWEKTPTVLDYLDDTEPFDWDE